MQTLRIGVVLQGCPGWIGGVEYSKNLIKALYRLPDELQAQFELLPYAGRQFSDTVYADMPRRFVEDLRRAERPGWNWRRVGKIISKKAFSPVFTWACQAKIDFLYPFVPHPLHGGRMRSAGWIPDFQHYRLPDFFSQSELCKRDENFARLIHRSQCVVLSSQSAERDCHRFMPESVDKTRVLSFCTTPHASWLTPRAPAVAEKYNLPERFFLVSNQFWKHKNHRVIFKALHHLRQQNIRPYVVCTGRLNDYRNPGYAAEVRCMLRDYEIAEQVKLVGTIPRVDQIQFMRRSLAVIQPSLFEGWSTVVEDARALGKSILISSIDVHREQNPPYAEFFDPLDGLQLASLMQRQWAAASPGPDAQREAAALLQNERHTIRYATQFLGLADAAFGWPHAA